MASTFAKLVAMAAGAGLGLTALGGAALAQAPATPASTTPASPTWTDPEFARIAGMLTGSWKSTAPIKVGSESFEVVTSVAPVSIPGLPNALYAEVARADALDRPYRQTVWQLHKVRGETRLKTMEFRRPKGELISVVGLWAAPQAFPQTIGMNDLVTTLDIKLTPDGQGFKGATPHPYPTAAGGATEMTSEIAFDGSTFKSADRGFGADGSVVWGPGQGDMYTFSRVESPVKVERMDDGLVMITYPTTLDGAQFQPNHRISMHYIGALENGFIFDSSYERGSPFQYQYGLRLISGWMRGTELAQKGLKRRLVIPSNLAYGERGEPRAKIPPNSNLVFLFEVLDVQPVPVEPQTTQPQAADLGVQVKPIDAPPTGQPAKPQ